MSSAPLPSPRRRLSREDRFRQLIAMSRRIICEEGVDTLTLGYLAERSGVTKPVVYDHFGTRSGLLVALYQDYDIRQTAVMDAAIAASADSLEAKARVIADCYVDCVSQQGREIPGVLAALACSPELEATKRDYQTAFLEKCRTVLAPFAAGIPTPRLWAILGAADALSTEAAVGGITADQAKDELAHVIVAAVSGPGSRP
ncbi:MAG: TetR/AcrR family transcriptional regulator [Telmatospirillum sp.]|nr:TetR/AcrR family transcriptional regulator [Telmatospirillum sp.]